MLQKHRKDAGLKNRMPTEKHDQQHTRTTNRAMPQRHQSTSTCYAQSSLQKLYEF